MRNKKSYNVIALCYSGLRCARDFLVFVLSCGASFLRAIANLRGEAEPPIAEIKTFSDGTRVKIHYLGKGTIEDKDLEECLIDSYNVVKAYILSKDPDLYNQKSFENPTFYETLERAPDSLVAQ